mmetsp:Transcript_80762/g.145754  ORF Transcript_80762/g.145754 Transcript_80762/m.145754 type:complete len:480 (-) Transcript_80762:42-1481(-)
MQRRERSRSGSRLAALSIEDQEEILSEFARHFWISPDGPGVSPWSGDRAAKIIRFRNRLVVEVDRAAGDPDDPDVGTGCFELGGLSKDTMIRWQRFTFYDEVARMSDVLFRGPMEPRYADEYDLQLHASWRRLRSQIPDIQEFAALTAEYRVSAVRVAMMLETARPPEAAQLDDLFELPDARTLASLLSLRCEKDDIEELLELYRLVCQKLQGSTCAWCNEAFNESTSAGLFDGQSNLAFPATVPKVFVPQCGHAIHTLCFGSQLIPDKDPGRRGDCRRCGLPYAWTSIDVEPMVNAFCLLFGPYVDTRAQDMTADGQLSQTAIMSIAEVCTAFSLELCGLVSASSAWMMLARRHCFAEPATVDIIGEEVLRLLAPPGTFGPPLPALPFSLLDDESGDDLEADEAQQQLADDDRPGSENIHEVFLDHMAGDSDSSVLNEEPDELDDEYPDPSAVMMGQLVEGCGETRCLNGLLPMVPGV